MEYRTFAPKDPFKPSLHYSLRNIFLGRKISTNYPRQLSRIPYPDLETETPRPRKEVYPSLRPSFYPSRQDLSDAPREDEPPTPRDTSTSPRPSERPLVSPISLPTPHGLASTRPPTSTPPLPSESSIQGYKSAHTVSSESALYFSSHHSDDDSLRDSFNLSSDTQHAPRSIYGLTEGAESMSVDDIASGPTSPVEPVSQTITRQELQVSPPGSLYSARLDRDEDPASGNAEVLRHAAPSESVVRSSIGQALRRSPSGSLHSLGARNQKDPPIVAPVEERFQYDPRIQENKSFDGVPPPRSPVDTVTNMTISLPKHSLHVMPSRKNSPLPTDAKLEDEQGDLVSVIQIPSDLHYVPSTPSSKTNVDIEIVSTPSGCDENTMFGIPSYALAFILDTIPRQLYHYVLLFLPSLYYSRVSRIFIDSQLSVYEIDKCILDEAVERHRFNMPLWRPVKLRRRHVDVWSPYDDLEESWQALTDSFMREWNTLNIISGLLLTAIITILQIGNAGKDPLIRHTALLSMICALMSLLYGCMYVIRFGTMQKTYKGAEWAYEADKPRTAIFWNVWVMLAMPAIWLGWSILMFIVCIGSFIWRTGTTIDDNLAPHTPHQVISARVVVSFILALGIIYFTLIVATLREYGDVMDAAWMNRVSVWVEVYYEHQRMQEQMQAMQNVMQEVRLEAPRPIMQQVFHEPEREYFMDRPSPMMPPRFDYAPPPPVPVFDHPWPPQPLHTEYNSGGLFGPRSPGGTGSLFSHRRSPTPPPPGPQLRASSVNSKASDLLIDAPSPPFPRPSSVLSVAPPDFSANDHPHPPHISIPPPMSPVILSHGPEIPGHQVHARINTVMPRTAASQIYVREDSHSPATANLWMQQLPFPEAGTAGSIIYPPSPPPRTLFLGASDVRIEGGIFRHHVPSAVGDSATQKQAEDVTNMPEIPRPQHGGSVRGLDSDENLTSKSKDVQDFQHRSQLELGEGQATITSSNERHVQGEEPGGDPPAETLSSPNHERR